MAQFLKSTRCSSAPTSGSSQPSVIPGPGDLAPRASGCIVHTNVSYSHMQALIHANKTFQKKNQYLKIKSPQAVPRFVLTEVCVALIIWQPSSRAPFRGLQLKVRGSVCPTATVMTGQCVAQCRYRALLWAQAVPLLWLQYGGVSLVSSQAGDRHSRVEPNLR